MRRVITAEGTGQVTPELMQRARREQLLTLVPTTIRQAARDMSDDELEEFVGLITRPAINREGMATPNEIQAGIVDAMAAARHNPNAGRDWLLDLARKGRLG